MNDRERSEGSRGQGQTPRHPNDPNQDRQTSDRRPGGQAGPNPPLGGRFNQPRPDQLGYRQDQHSARPASQGDHLPMGDDLDDDDDDQDNRPSGPSRKGHYDRPKDVKRREEVGELMQRFNWAAKARGMSQTEVSLMVGTDQLRFNRDVNVVVKHGYVNPKMLMAYQSILRLSLDYILAEKGDDVPEDRRLEPMGDVPRGVDVAKVLADHGVVGNEAMRDVVVNALLLHQFRLHPGEVLDLLSIKQQRDREEAARRIYQSLDRIGPMGEGD